MQNRSNHKNKQILEREIKDLIAHNRNIGLFSISIIFGLVIGIGGNVIYDWYIKENTLYGLLALVATFFIIGFFIKTARDAEKKMNALEEKLKDTE